MAKRKTTIQLPNVQKEHYHITKAGVKVYPIHYRGKWFIEINNNGKIQRFEKEIEYSQINLAIAKTIKYCFNRLTQN